jgi:hypothetical protein
MNNSYTCSNGHISQDPDYCTECGAKMSLACPQTMAPPASAGLPAQAAVASAGTNQICPDCGTEQSAAAKFCEVCRHPFAGADAPSEEPVPSASATIPTVEPTQVPAAAQSQAASSSAPHPRFVAVVAVDRQQAAEQGAADECPADRADLRFPLDFNTILVGRSSEQRRIFPELDIADTGISHRHLRLERHDDHSFSAVELGSSNGTTFNGRDMKTGTAMPLRAGDVLRLGIWTRITIEEQ